MKKRAPSDVAQKKDAAAAPIPSHAPPVEHSWRAGALRAATAEHYEDAELYDHEYRRRREDLRYYRALALQVAHEQPPGSRRGRPLRILELGCGTGRLLLPLVKDGHEVVGVDLSGSMLQRCQQRLERLKPAQQQRAQLLQGDFRELPLPGAPPANSSTEDPRFHLILCPFNGFMHLYTRQDVERCLAEVRRLLLPGGLFALDVLNPDPVWLARDSERRWSRTRFRHPQTGERLVYSTNHLYDSESQIAWIRIYYERDLKAAAVVEAEKDPSLSSVNKAINQPPSAKSKATQGSVQSIEDACVHTVQLAHRQFYPAELEALLHYNGFEMTQRLGGFDGQVLSPVSTEQVICARVNTRPHVST